MAELEDAKWETGKASGSFYCGDHDHYEFMGEAYSMYSHMNALQRDVCPSATRFEGEIIAMGLDLMHASAATDGEPCGMLTSGGSGSILHAMLAYREQATRNGHRQAEHRQARDRPPGVRQGLPPARAWRCGDVPIDSPTPLRSTSTRWRR